jgi:hypothetical protein
MQDDDVDLAPQLVVPGVDAPGRLSLEQILAQLTPDQRDQVRDFAEFLLARRAPRPPFGAAGLTDLLEEGPRRRE